MLIKLLWKLLDEPLAIVVGAVGLVLVVLQLAAVGVVARNQADRRDDNDLAQRSRKAATLHCLAAGSRDQHAACLLKVGGQVERRYDDSGLGMATVGYQVR